LLEVCTYLKYLVCFYCILQELSWAQAKGLIEISFSLKFSDKRFANDRLPAYIGIWMFQVAEELEKVKVLFLLMEEALLAQSLLMEYLWRYHIYLALCSYCRNHRRRSIFCTLRKILCSQQIKP
jgi:hypothetical protein